MVMADLVTRLLEACTSKVNGISVCPIHQVGNRCLTCQAADVIDRFVRAELKRQDASKFSDGPSHGKIDP